MSEDTRSNYIITITYDYKHGNRYTKRLLVLNSLISRNAIKQALEYVPYDQHIVATTCIEYKLPTLGSVVFELEQESGR